MTKFSLTRNYNMHTQSYLCDYNNTGNNYFKIFCNKKNINPNSKIRDYKISINNILKIEIMKTNSKEKQSANAQEKVNNVRIYASDSEILDEELTLKKECNYKSDFSMAKCNLQADFLNKKYLRIEIIGDVYHRNDNENSLYEFTGIYTINLTKVDDKKYMGKENFNLDSYYYESFRSSFLDSVLRWGEEHNLDLKIKKNRRLPYKSPSKYFPKKESYIGKRLIKKRRTQMTEIERVISELLFYSEKFKPEWFFERSDINRKYKLSGQEFDSVIESLINKKVLGRNEDGWYHLNITI